MPRKQLEPGEAVEVVFAAQARDLILEHAPAGSTVTDRLSIAEVRGAKLVASLTLDDLDELIGHVTAEAVHTADRKLEKAWDGLFRRLKAPVEYHDDVEWRQAF